ncbi:MAG: hypothetical protein DI603_14550 [Roseateles depolymerans]|uniref:AGC-kinase C-terminal domain-containing protein n=1 Tax=Roseateles depolymerans TaxID=76731 RepID=A0A2W5DNL1_9BURK|nr:MAG: hypothetical protein DI603_14550 [Roseateles depolymerans]
MERLSEKQALEVCVVRGIEQSGENGGLWTGIDAKEATRVALDLTGRDAGFSTMLSRRAEWAISHIAKRTPDKAIRLKEPTLPAVAAWILCAIAFFVGYMTDYLASKQQVDVVEYRLLGLIVWNVAIFLGVFFNFALKVLPGDRKPPGLISEAIAKLRFKSALGFSNMRRHPWMTACQDRWIQLSHALTITRTNITFHAAAICFAIGVVASLYLRGLPTQYIPGVAGSTWLDIKHIQKIFNFIVTPGAELFGLEIPDVQVVANMQASGDNLGLARALFHLHAASLIVWVLIPRAFLIIVNAVDRWRLRRAFPLPLNAAYFTALRSAWRGQKIAVAIVPFRYDMTPQVKSNLQRMLERIYGMSVEIEIHQSVLMGDDPNDWKRALNKDGHVAVFPVFNVVATAEADTHGVLLKKVRSAVEPETPVVPIVDTTAFPAVDDKRLRSRQLQWRQILDRVRAEPLFLDLGRADDADLSNFQRRLNRDE